MIKSLMWAKVNCEISQLSVYYMCALIRVVDWQSLFAFVSVHVELKYGEPFDSNSD